MRLIVNFDKVGNDTVLTLYKSPSFVVGSDQGQTIQIPALTGTTVQDRGAQLDRLLRLHAPVNTALTIALAQPPAAPPQPIYFRTVADVADALPWEQWFAAPMGFVALDPRWPVGRIGKRVQDLSDRSYIPPFRVVALLAAAGREGTPQLEALAGAVAHARTQGLDVRLHVITGEQAVLDRVAALGRSTLTSELIGTTVPEVARQITEAKPSILHLLCHGGFAAPGVRGLSMATLQDMLAEEEVGSVVMSIDALARALQPCDPWLVVLAACETAEAAAGTAVAQALVDTGVPTVIGMRRLVDLDAMNRFCEALYPEVLGSVVAAVHGQPGSGPVRAIDWVTTLTAPRQAALAGANPAQADGWSDPVLYAQQDVLRVYVPEGLALTAEHYAELKGRLDMLLDFRRTRDPATTPPEVLAWSESEIARLQGLLPEASDA